MLVLIVLFPVLLLVYIFIILESRGGGFYFQKRVGRNGIDFTLFKFRSMYINSDKERLITIGEKDSRLTKAGIIIRRFKLDELPQLINVLKGDMSIVGPRPEVRKYVDKYSTKQQNVLNVRPGLTDYASIEYIHENEILGKAFDPEKTYIEEIMPHKILLNMKYIENQNIKEYFRIIIRTLLRIVKN